MKVTLTDGTGDLYEPVEAIVEIDVAKKEITVASQRRDGLVSQGRTRHLLRRGDERRGRSARLEVLRFR